MASRKATPLSLTLRQARVVLEREVGLTRLTDISDWEVVGLTTGRHLVPTDAEDLGVHDWPVPYCRISPMVGLRPPELSESGAAEINLDCAALDEDASPDDLARLGDAAQHERALYPRDGTLVLPRSRGRMAPAVVCHRDPPIRMSQHGAVNASPEATSPGSGRRCGT